VKVKTNLEGKLKLKTMIIRVHHTQGMLNTRSIFV